MGIPKVTNLHLGLVQNRFLMVLLYLFMFRLLLSLSASAESQSIDSGLISAVISEKGLNYVKDLLIEQELKTLVPLKINDIGKSVRIPFVGIVHISVENLVLSSVTVTSSTVDVENGSVIIVASGATATLNTDWRYVYSSWLVPIEVSDKGTAFIQVEGMEIDLAIIMKSQDGTLELAVTNSRCYMKDLSITLEGGASWFYQGFVNAFEDQIRSAVQTAIKKKISEGTSKLDSLLRALPKKIDVEDGVALNVTFVGDPIFEESSIELNINGLFIPSHKIVKLRFLHGNSWTSDSCLELSKMLGLSLDEKVFNSASTAFFQAGSMHWLVDEVPDQSLLHTNSYRFIIPKLYKMYPNHDMELNITIITPPIVNIKSQGIKSTITADMIVNVLDGSNSIPVACLKLVADASGIVEISGNNLAGRVELNDFSLELKWSNVGNFHMTLIQGVMRVFLNTVFVPLVNSRLGKGFPLPTVHGFTLQNADIIISTSKIVVCTDVLFTDSAVALRLGEQRYLNMLR